MTLIGFMERLIARQAIADLLAAGYLIDVNDGEVTTVEGSGDPAVILAAMFTTDEDYLVAKGVGSRGWVRFIYGNDGWDVINDYTVNLAGALTRTTALTDQLSEGKCPLLEAAPDLLAVCEALVARYPAAAPISEGLARIVTAAHAAIAAANPNPQPCPPVAAVVEGSTKG